MINISRDIKLFFNPLTKGEFADIEIDNGDFVPDEGLETMVLISLFSDVFVEKDSSYNGESRGYFGDYLFNYPLGSKLWQLDRAKIDKTTITLATQYMKECLEWMVTDGIADRIETLAQKAPDRSDTINLYIAIYKPGSDVEGFKYSTQWKTQLGLGG